MRAPIPWTKTHGCEKQFQALFLASLCHSTLLPHHVFHPKTLRGWQEVPWQKENDTKSYKKSQKIHPNYSAAFSKNKQLQPLKIILFRNRSKPRPTLRTRNRPSSVASSSHHWEVKLLPLMRAMNPGVSEFRVSGSFQAKGVFRPFFRTPQKKINTSKLGKKRHEFSFSFLGGCRSLWKSF